MRHFRFIFLVFLPVLLTSQNQTISFRLFDEVSKDPVSDAHVFITNATYGTTSNAKGECKFEVAEMISEELIISHILYDTKVIKYSGYHILTLKDSVFVSPNNIDLDAITIVHKRSRNWKRNFKRFQKSFIGVDKAAQKTKILNPEVLRFEEKDGIFRTTAVDDIHIENNFLGYDIDFTLKELIIEPNGSSRYVGYPSYQDKSKVKNQEKIEKRRKEKYVNSLRHFMVNLIHDNLEEAKYKINISKYANGAFQDLGEIAATDIVRFDSLSGLYHVRFNDFLEVTHLGIKEISESKPTIKLSGKESRKFGDMQTSESGTVVNAISRLYKISPSLIVDKYGKIINHKHVREYDYWANQRMSSSLPLDYGIELIPHVKVKEPSQIIEGEGELNSLTIAKNLIYGDVNVHLTTFKYLEDNWKDEYLPVLLDIMRVIDNNTLTKEIRLLIKSKTGSSNYYEGLQYLWKQGSVYGESYSEARAEVLQFVDPKFKTYFEARAESSLINMNEIVWGGVKQDGIPPLRYPKSIDGIEADYLDDKDVVFAININGTPRAYPKRILAWHEMFIDTIGGVDIAGVYCTLCGTMIGYDTHINGKRYALGTSGFLYRSNKLMYDEATQSLWSTIDGKPVVGPLIDMNLELDVYPIITTTWGEWKALHPDSKVLSLETGYKRNYDEGVAYSAYFSTDELMFPVPLSSNKVKNKEEVIVIRTDDYNKDPLVITIQYLKRKKVHNDEISGQRLVVISEKSGTSRAYESKGVTFKSYKHRVLKDEENGVWKVTEDRLIGPNNEQLERLPSHNAFWFAWHNMYPNTRLVK